MSVIQRIRKDKLESEDFSYIDDYEKFMVQAKIHDDVILKEGINIGIDKGINIGYDKGIVEMILSAYEAGLPIGLIATIAKLPIEKVKAIIKQFEKDRGK